MTTYRVSTTVTVTIVNVNMKTYDRDWEDLLFPWVPFVTRYTLDRWIYPFTFSVSNLINLLSVIITQLYHLYLLSKKVSQNHESE